LILPKGFKVSDKPGPKEKMSYKFGSDHYSFYKKGVPIVNLFTGLHTDYHTPEDKPEKINYQNLFDITGFSLQFVQKVANNTLSYPLRP